MSTVQLNGIEFQFPFVPYTQQRAFMGQIMRSARDKKNALLESPTGTGKTLSILCASLAWLNNEIELRKGQITKDIANRLNLDSNDDFFENLSQNKHDGGTSNSRKQTENMDDCMELMPKIYFASRTHSQLSQSIKELKKANYYNNTSVVLAGRDVLCLNEDVQKLDNIGAKNQACKSKIGANCSCKYYRDYDKKIPSTRDYYDNPILDVEDLVKYGEKHSICPYFASRYIQKKSQIIFLPYNYLLDPKIRKAQRISFNDDIIIFDEGHNIEKTCEESISIDLRSDHLAICIREMQTIYQYYQQSIENQLTLDSATLDAVKEFTTEDLLLLKKTLDDLEMQIDEKMKQLLKEGKNKGDVCDINWIFDLQKKCNIDEFNSKKIADICDKIQSFLTCILPIKGPAAMNSSSSLNSFKDFLNVLNPGDTDDIGTFQKELKQKFAVYLEIIDEDNSNFKAQAKEPANEKKSAMSKWLKTSQPEKAIKKWILHIWCLSPSVGLKSLIKTNVRSVVLTSGTLAPLDSFEAEFDVKFENKIQNSHIIKNTQMAIFPVSQSYSGTRLDSTYANKDNINYYKALGDTIVDICTRVPGGVLVFFQSYAVMNNAIRKWEFNESVWKIWSKLNKIKPIFQEQKNKEEFNDQLDKFRAKVESGKGATFFAICRGKLSEGIDLSDEYSRGVILVGLPYPSTQDPRVKLKKNYLDTVKHPNFTSNIWYTLQMKRALNQAIGRAIRHKNDYGCVFLLDYRFENPKNDLSKWCRDYVKQPTTYRDMIVEVEKFFENNLANGNLRRIKPIRSNDQKEPMQLDQNDNKNFEIQTSSLDFSLSDYTSVKNKKGKQGKKRTMYESSLDNNTKKAKNLLSQNAANIFDSIEPANRILREEANATTNKRPRHIEIEYDNKRKNEEVKPSNNSVFLIDDNQKDDKSDSIQMIIMDD